MKNYIIILCILVSSVFGDGLKFNEIPIQEDGRIKPLDSFARNQLLIFSGKSELPSYNAIELLFNILNRDPDVKNEQIFKIENPDVVKMLGMDIVSDKSLYSFNDINTGLELEINKKKIEVIKLVTESERNLLEKQLWDLHVKRGMFLDLYNSALALLPMMHIENPEIAKAFNVETGEVTSFSYYVRNKSEIHTNLAKLIHQNEFRKNETLLTDIGFIMDMLNFIESNIYHNINDERTMNYDVLKLCPSIQDSTAWISPNILMMTANAPETPLKISNIQNELVESLELFFNPNAAQENVNAIVYKQELVSIIEKETNIDSDLLIREVNYNKLDLLFWSLIFYIAALITLTAIAFIRIKNKKLRIIPFILIMIGFLYHLSAIIMRITILNRPPISTLYESIIFVGLIAVLFAIILELIKKDGLYLFIGSIVGIILHYISFGYATDGDTFGVLIAVLNSNFWLSTHVTTITIGYGITLIAGLVGHLYLIKANWNPNNTKELKIIYDNMLALTFIALFFTMFGTILGGIWGDQSWGRFWGWDPKENGALLIVMWLLMMVHLRLSGMVKGAGYALGLVLVNITVALAWFGVNLLSVGLHTYGFTDGAAMNLFAFILFEFLFGIILYSRLYWKLRIKN